MLCVDQLHFMHLNPQTMLLIFQDVSGLGYVLGLDDIKLLSASMFSSFQLSEAFNPTFTFPSTSMPLFGMDAIQVTRPLAAVRINYREPTAHIFFTPFVLILLAAEEQQ